MINFLASLLQLKVPEGLLAFAEKQVQDGQMRNKPGDLFKYLGIPPEIRKFLIQCFWGQFMPPVLIINALSRFLVFIFQDKCLI